MSSAWLKTGVVFLGVLLFRLLPFRAPNVEPLLASVMPISTRYGALAGVAFTLLSFVVYDALTAGWGIWTLVPAVCYALIAVGSHIYFKYREATRWNFVKFGAISVVLYDAATGLTIGPIFEGQNFMNALSGQIPFTALHLLGAVALAYVLSPALYRWLEEAPAHAAVPAQVR